MGLDPVDQLKLHRKVCHTTHICIDVCGVQINNVHSTKLGMSCACIYLEVHKHPISQGICHESINMAYQCNAEEVSKTLNAKTKKTKNCNKQTILAHYLLKIPIAGENNHLYGSHEHG